MNAEIPTVGVGISVYNDEENILRLLSSLKQQDMKISETIIVNDGSSDETLKRLRECGEDITNSLNINVVDLTQNRGFANALNTIFKTATSEHLIIVPSDVVLFESDVVRKMINGCQTSNNVGLVCGWHRVEISNPFSALMRTYRFSSMLLERVFKNNGHDILATGAIWALPREVYSILRLPVDLYRIDAYLYLNNLTLDKEFVFVPEAKPIIRMEKERLKQYLYRQARTRTIPSKHLETFGSLAEREFKRPNVYILARSFIECLVLHPVDGLCWTNLKVISYIYRKTVNPQPTATWRTDETS